MLERLQSKGLSNTTLKSKKKVTEIIAVTSGKGGVGKSTFSSNLAISFQQMSRKVLLIDADIHLGNIDMILGIRSPFTISDVISQNMPVRDVIVSGPGKIDILTASSAAMELLENEDMALRKLSLAFGEFDHDYDLIILDTGAGIAQNVIAFLLTADKIVLVVTPDPASITDAYAVIKVVSAINPEIPVLLTANMVRSAEEGEVLFKKMNLMVQKFLHCRLFYGGAMIQDEIIARSVKTRAPFIINHPNSASTNALRNISRRILQTPVEHGLRSSNLFERVLSTKKATYQWKP
jgi:flagellar biosynthesis protein FlhG